MKNKIGVLVAYGRDTDIAQKFAQCKAIGIDSCQLSIWDVDVFCEAAHAQKIKDAAASAGMSISTIWAGYSGPCEWNFISGPDTIGLVPVAYRATRLEELKRASDFAAMLGVDKIATHVGFIPENPTSGEFNGVVAALRHLCSYMKAKGQTFLFETGQETPITVLRTIQAIGTDNLGINLDTANPILYGKGHPVDALDVFGSYVKDTHIKDGFFPTDGMYLGKETRAGDGKANIPLVVSRLINEFGYTGPFTIEREISGEKQIEDIVHAKKLLEDSMA